MTPEQWKALPPLVRRKDVLAVGIDGHALSDLVVVVTGPEQRVPFRKIAAMRGLRGRAGKRNGAGRMLFVKATVSVLLGREYR